MYNDLFHIGPVTSHGYGLMIGIGFLTAIVVTMLRAKKKGLNAEMILDLALICIFADKFLSKSDISILVSSTVLTISFVLPFNCFMDF